MERRQAERKSINGDAACGVIFMERAELSDVSNSGVRFKFFRKIDPNTTQKIAVRHNEDVLHLRGQVVRSKLVNTRWFMGSNYPVYEVAMHFDGITEEKAASLNRLMEKL